MRIDCPPAVQGTPNLPVITRLAEAWSPADIEGMLHLEEANPGRTRLLFDGGNTAKRLWLCGAAFDSRLLEDRARRGELARVTKRFLKDASHALFARPTAVRAVLDS